MDAATQYLPENFSFLPMFTALAIGLLIGLERGWQDRSDPDGSRIAGIRTFGLIGFLGGLLAFIDQAQGFVIAAGLIGLTVLLREGLKAQISVTKDVSITTVIAALLTFALGVLAVRVSTQLAASGAVLTALVLWLRPSLHALLHRIDETELSAFLRWLLISVVVLPVLPNEAFGPYDTLNPRTIWWMVVIISGLGFLGYVGLKYLGRRRGTGLLALTGGMVSSTAVTLSFARFARSQPTEVSSFVGGTLIAWAIMIIRTFVVIAVLSPELLKWAVLPLGLMLLVSAFGALFFLLRPRPEVPVKLDLPNPLDLTSALVFAAILTAAMILSTLAGEMFGDVGLYTTSIIAGAVDIDAISLSLTGNSAPNLSAQTLATGICLAALANTALKACIAGIIGRGTYGQITVLAGIGLILAGGIGVGLMLTGQIS